MYPIAEKLPNEIERAAFVEALALIGTDQQDEYYSFCEIGKLISGYSKSMVSLIDSANLSSLIIHLTSVLMVRQEKDASGLDLKC